MRDDDDLEARLAQMLDAKRGALPEELPAAVERRVLARLTDAMPAPRARRWWLGLSLACATAMGVAVLVQTLRPEPAMTELVTTLGEVAVAPKLERVTTPSGGQALLTAPRARIALLADSSAVFAEVTEKRVHITLERGSLVANVEPNHPERAFAVSLPHAEVIVTGTVFYAAASGERASVAVEHGRVIVRHGTNKSETTSVAAGELVELNGAGVVRRPLRDDESAAMLSSLSATTWRSPAVEALAHGLAAPPPGPAPTPEEPMPTFEPGPTPAPSLDRRAATHRPRSAKAPAGVKSAGTEVSALLAEGDCVTAKLELEKREERGDAASRAWFELAQCFSGRGDVAAALSAYRELVRRFPSAVVTENAAYEVARLSRDLHKNDEAEAAFADYVTRYPKGALVQEAYFWRCHMAATNGRIDAALACLRGFRERFPTSSRASQTYFSEATLLRTSKHDCEGAVAAYDRYLRSPGEHREQAEQWRAWCEARLH